MKTERRMHVGTVEVRQTGEARQIRGYAALFDTEAVIGGQFREVIRAGAFRAAVGAESDVRGTFNHDPNLLLGRTTAKTLTLVEDERGLSYVIDPPDTTYAKDLMTSLTRGDVTGSSYGFKVKRDEWTPAKRAGELPLRTIHEFEQLLDVGPVTYPAFEETTAEARSAAAAAAAPTRDAGQADELSPEETACVTASAAAMTALSAMITACTAMLADAENGAIAREAVSTAASMLQTCGRLMASCQGQPIYSYYSAADVVEHRKALDLVAAE